MRVFVTGATGFVGTAVVRELIAAGHQVLGLARSDRAAAALAEAGIVVHRGELTDLDSLRAGAKSADGVIHTAFVHDFGGSYDFEAASATDRAAIRAMGEELAGTDRPLVITSGTAILPPGELGTEDSVPEPGSFGSVRFAAEEVVAAFAEHGVRPVVVRLPPTTHGVGDHGFMAQLIAAARTTGVSGYPGDGSNRWSSVHRLDAAGVFRLGLESAPAGARLHAVADEGVPVRAIAEAIGRGLDLPVASVPVETAAERWGFIGMIFSSDVPASGARTRELLGWQPTRSSLLADLAEGHYFGSV
jgi:nucleoside-diphosphate-sugar epimerase